MLSITLFLRRIAACMLFCVAAGAGAQDIASKFAETNGVRLHYLVAGQGAPVILLHGYAQTAHMWRPLMKQLAKTNLVIASDLRGAGASDAPETGYARADMVRDTHALAGALKLGPAPGIVIPKLVDFLTQCAVSS